MTGLSGSGKTTLAHRLKERLTARGIIMQIIDADTYRATLCKDLGFSAADRRENIRRLARVANHYYQKGIPSIIAAINPYEDVRAELRQHFGAVTVWVKCELSLLILRDTKGLYRRALLPDDDPGKIRNLSGMTDPYETPLKADLVIDTGIGDVEASTQQLLDYVLAQLTVSRLRVGGS